MRVSEVKRTSEAMIFLDWWAVNGNSNNSITSKEIVYYKASYNIS